MPKSLSQLNQYSNRAIVYQDQRAYSISFSANAAANTSTTIDEDDYFIVPTGIDIANVISQPGNITYNINLSNVANAILTWPTMPGGVTSSSSGNVYSITGTFSPVTWAEVKQANVVVPDRETNFDFTANIQYPSTANTSVTNTWSWTNQVTVANINPDVFFTTSYTFNEYQTTQIVYTIDDPDPTIVNYSVAVGPRAGSLGRIFLNGVDQGSGNTAVITGNIATVQSANISYVPYPAATSAALRADAYKTNGVGNVSVESNVSLNLSLSGNIESKYTLTNSYSYIEDAMVNLAFDITDTDANASSYIVGFTDNTANAGVFFVNGVSQGVGNAAVLANSKTNINAANVSYLPRADYTGNVTMSYTQTQVNSLFGNISQASNVPVTMTCTATHNEISVPSTYNENTLTANIQITDTDAYATNYILSLQQTSGNVGRWYANGSFVGLANSALVLSNTKSNLNSAGIRFMPAVTDNGPVTLTVTQSKTNSLFGNITQLSNVAYNLSVATTYPAVSNIGNISYLGKQFNTGLFSTAVINDGPDYGQTYTITLNSAQGKFGNSIDNAWAANSYSFTGNTTQINSEFANLGFAPYFDSTTGTYSYTQSRDGIAQVNLTNTLTKTGNANITTITSYTANTTWTPTLSQVLYGSANILLVGGGGAQGYNIGDGGGGGGGGGVATHYQISQGNIANSYTITVGAGGVASSLGYGSGNGNATSISLGNVQLATVAGGGEGRSTIKIGNITYGGDGGNTIGNTSFSLANTVTNYGGQGVSGINIPGDYWAAGGGAAANIDISGSGGFANSVSGTGGSAGNGQASDITGSTVYYGAGGPGAGRNASGATGLGAGGPGCGGGPGAPGNGLNGIVIIKIT